MNLIQLIPSGAAVIALSTEDLAGAVLRSLNSQDEPRRRRDGLPEQFSLFNYCSQQADLYSNAARAEISVAISAAFQNLITTGMLTPNPFGMQFGWFVLTPRAKALRSDADYKRYTHAAKYPRGIIEPAVEEVTFAEFIKGDYETAVFKAFKLLEELVRGNSGVGNEQIGVQLMRMAFRPRLGPLTDKSEHEGEQEALMHLMAGAVGRFKNPTSHRFTGLDDPVTTIEILHVASLLIRIATQRPVERNALPAAPEEHVPGGG